MLAIGIVVDDAIVVIENVERIMAEEKVPPRVAADRAMGQVASALVAIVLSLCAVFLPVAFLGGITGEMYKQFAITLVVAVVISGIVALTLTPALCAVLLQGHAARASQQPVLRLVQPLVRPGHRPLRAVGGRVDAARPSRWLASFAVMLALAVVLLRRVPSGFIPTEDKGYFGIAIQLPDGASLQRTEAVGRAGRETAPEAAGGGPTWPLVGFNLLPRHNQTNGATMFVLLKPWDERDRDRQLDASCGRINGQLFGSKDAVAFGFNLPEIPGLGTTAGLEVNLQDRSGAGHPQVRRAGAGGTRRHATQQPELQGVPVADPGQRAPDLRPRGPGEGQVARGVAVDELFATLQTMLSTLYVNDFNLYGRTYRVQAEAQSQFRQRPEDIGRLYVRAPDGRHDPDLRAGPHRVPGRPQPGAAVQRVHLRPRHRPPPRPGYSSGQMLDAVERLADRQFAPQGVGYAFSGQSYQERAASGQAGLVFVLRPGAWCSWCWRRSTRAGRFRSPCCWGFRSACSARSSACGCAACRATSTSRSGCSRWSGSRPRTRS